MAALFSACGPGEREADLTATDAAVIAASARVIGVDESHNAVNGLGTDIYYELRLDSKKPLSVEDLDSIIDAIWKNSPFEPNVIHLMAFADEAQEKPVDLRTSAAGLEPEVMFNGFGQAGVSVGRMWKRYGDWDEVRIR